MAGRLTTPELSALTLADVLELCAAESPVPGAGSAAALSAALAASLVMMAARRSRESWPEARGIAAQALVRRRRCLELASSGAEALAAAVEALERREAVEAPLRRTVDQLLALAAAAADVAELAALAAERAHDQVRPDAAAAAVLAESAVRVSGALIRANLTVTPRDERLDRLALAEVAAERAARRAAGAA